MKNNENYEGLRRLRVAKRPWFIRLLPDEAKLLCYTQVSFDGEDRRYNYYPEKILFVALERPMRYLLNGLKTLYAVMANVKYLNGDLSDSELKYWCEYIVEHHFISPFDSEIISTVVSWVIDKYEKGTLRPNGKFRRIIFNKGFPLTTEEKLRIVGELTTKTSQLTEQIIYDCIEEMQNNDVTFTICDIAKTLGVSVSTVGRSITQTLKDHMKDINRTIRDNRDLTKLQKVINSYTDLKMKYKVSDLRKKCGFSGHRLKYLKSLMDGHKSLI